MNERKKEAGEPEDGVIDETLADEVTRAVSDRLKRDYNGLLSEPVPDRFTDLLDKLSTIPSDAPETAEPTGQPGQADEKTPSDTTEQTTRQEG